MLRFISWERRDPEARVLQVTNMWPIEADGPGPAGSPGPRYGIFVKRQVDSLVEAGVRCDVLLIRGFESRLAYVIAALFLFAKGFARQYQLVHVHAGETAFAARFYLTAPMIVTYYGSDLLGTPRADGSVPTHMRLLCSLQSAHARLTTRTITQSREMENVLPVPVQHRNLVIPSGVDPEVFSPVDREAARKELGWAPGERIALFAADPAVPRKRVWLAQEACAWVRGRVEGLRLHVAANVAPGDMPLLMSAADCLLLTSSIEGSPNVVKEAILCNLPVVTTRVGDVEKVLAEIKPSWFCDATPDSLGAALAECLSKPQRSNGREASGWLRSATIAQPHLDLYEDLAPGSTSR